MSLSAQESSPPGAPFVFDGVAINEMVTRLRDQNPGNVERRELLIMNVNNSPLVGSYNRLKDQAEDIQEATGLGMGFLVGWQTLRMTTVLVPVAEGRLLAFEQRYDDDPGSLVQDFQEDFAGHVAVLTLVQHTLQNPSAREGAMRVFSYHGDQAHQARPPRELPEPRRKLHIVDGTGGSSDVVGNTTVSLASLYPEHRSARTARKRRLEALTGSKRFDTTR